MSNEIKDTKDVLLAVKSGALSVDEALLRLRKAPFEDVGYAKVDLHRHLRQGAAEVIYGAGKTPEQIAGIVKVLRENGEEPILITRMSSEAAAYVAKTCPLDYRPVIAVPTSVGYGAAFGGLSALLSMLNSCASGVSVVNIDNGFGAGYLASMINHMQAKGEAKT